MKKQQKLIIGVENEIIFIELYENIDIDEVIDREEWRNDGSSSEQLLKKIDIFLKQNNTRINNLTEVLVRIDEKQKYTLARIIKTVVNTINYCLKN